MKKIYILIMIICFTLSFNITAGGQGSGADKDFGFIGLTVSTEYDGENVVIPVSELSRAMNMDFSYNDASGFLFAEKDGRSLHLKLLEEQHMLDERGLILYGYDLDKPYNSFNVKLLMSYTAKNSHDSAISPIPGHEETDGAVAITNASIVIKDGEGFISLQKTGTSLNLINKESLKDILSSNLILVNGEQALDSGYIPQRLTDVAPARARTAFRMKIDSQAMASLDEMLEAAYSAGIKGYLVTSAYRPFEKQNYLFNNKVELLSKSMDRSAALEAASRVVAIPGTSEHQTGLAVDICSESVSIVRAFGSTPQGKWLEDNSWKHGFVVRYHQDKTDITRIIYEPWHIRYVGMGHAEIMKEKNLCLEEYMQYLKENKIVSFNAEDGSRYMVQYLEKSSLEGTGLALDLPDDYGWSVSTADEDGYVLTICY